MKETVLYYNPQKAAHAAKLKSVLVRMGIRIKNIDASQLHETVGYLAGIDGFGPSERSERDDETVIGEEMLILKDFTDRRLDELLKQLRKSGIPRIDLKAVVTQYNAGWKFSELYKEIKEEHEQMSQRKNKETEEA